LNKEGADELTTDEGQVALCISPGGEAMGYPKRREDKCDMKTISAEFAQQFDEGSVRIRTVLDGWSQAEMVGTTMGADFGGFDVLATSAQYRRKLQDTRVGWLCCLHGKRETCSRSVNYADWKHLTATSGCSTLVALPGSFCALSLISETASMKLLQVSLRTTATVF
jgi:hypothetical protein